MLWVINIGTTAVLQVSSVSINVPVIGTNGLITKYYLGTWDRTNWNISLNSPTLTPQPTYTTTVTSFALMDAASVPGAGAITDPYGRNLLTFYTDRFPTLTPPWVAQYTGYLTVTASNTYFIRGGGDDSFYVQLSTPSGYTVLSSNGQVGIASTADWASKNINLSANVNYPVNIIYQENGGGAVFCLELSATGIPLTHDWTRYFSTSNILGYYLLVGGGGGGGVGLGGVYEAGGGAGGVLQGTTILSTNTTYNITIGQGGAVNTNGQNTIAFNLTALGGGFGGYSDGGGAGSHAGGNGGSGGGGYRASGGVGTVGQGNNGAGGSEMTGGGGGAGTASVSISGGIGTRNLIAGSTIGQLSAGSYWIGGGGTGTYSGLESIQGGLGGGGGGGGGDAYASDLFITAGAPNTGGGGGGVRTGGSGVVVLSIPTAAYTGITTGSPTVSGNNTTTIITFLSSGSYTA